MRGRPRRKRHPELAARLRAAQVRMAFTGAELAAALGVSASTVSRSVAGEFFSPALEARASAALKEGGALWHAPDGAAPRRAARGRRPSGETAILQELRKIAMKLGEVQTAMDALLDRGLNRR